MVFNRLTCKHPCVIIDTLAHVWVGEFINVQVPTVFGVRSGSCKLCWQKHPRCVWQWCWRLDWRECKRFGSRDECFVVCYVSTLTRIYVFVLTNFCCWPMTVLDCDRAVQTWIPSCHVWRSFVLPKPPHFLNQEPPRPQQLILSVFSMVPHLGHTETVIVIASAEVFIWHWSRHEREKPL